MKKNITILFVVALLIGGFLWWQQKEATNGGIFPEKNDQSNEGQSYTIEEVGVKFAIPSGWYAKPYPVASTTVFLSPKDFEFPGAWGGPLTPIIIVVDENRLIDDEAYESLLETEPHLQVENLEWQGYQAIRVSGVPKDTGYLAGKYYESFSIQRGTDSIKIDYYGGDPELPEYLDKYRFIVDSLEI